MMNLATKEATTSSLSRTGQFLKRAFKNRGRAFQERRQKYKDDEAERHKKNFSKFCVVSPGLHCCFAV